MNNKSQTAVPMVVLILIGFLITGAGDLYAQPKNIICPQCGEENVAGAKFCWNDGFNLSKIQKQQAAIRPVEKPAAVKTFIPQTESQPKSVGQPELSFENVSSAEMELFLIKLTERLEAANVRKVRNPNYIGDLTQAEFRRLLENTLQNQNIVRTKVITKNESGFGSFLKAVGAGTLILIGLGILAAG
ncbi:MAG: zinc ribbon domain-containing protein [Candidatus Marinimicrobia bacterium]|nr:zinc ribbon domain-containing protein [Candidatus Neomarinimicrobiota bacterium]